MCRIVIVNNAERWTLGDVRVGGGAGAAVEPSLGVKNQNTKIKSPYTHYDFLSLGGSLVRQVFRPQWYMKHETINHPEPSSSPY